MRKLSAALTKSGAFLLGSTILCTSGTALAQQSNTNDDRDIVVTASKREQNLQDVPLAITAIGTERRARTGRLEAEHTGCRRRNADRAATVAGVRHRQDTRGHRRRAAG